MAANIENLKPVRTKEEARERAEQLAKEKEELEKHLSVNKIYEYMPAPGHQVNGYSVVGDFIHDGATMQEACDSAMSHFRNTWSVSLGGQGGYLVAGFREPVDNTNGDYELAIKGNPYSYQSEPGIIWVMKDENGINRFVEAQQGDYEDALAEITAGEKQGHRMSSL